ncbi:hypothetical protein N7492_005688 [Penicillium capsulatum]|uniref:Uncharacterized protein n=1 Tax=Penicillium capsulatum TaxID=69766 RepID=A0A9W9LS56_9EURO|nr:hypothetical protein N7492_005688 [Penicillium capsulatum]KAJ6135214.1 hypothetical protein N7512_000374 [Penicillium capsulatum]
MIDENLPTFFLKNNSQTPQQSTIYHRQHGNDPEPAYTLRSLDPALPSSHNRYGVALYDPFVPDVVYGEVAVIPEWTQPSVSAETIRANGGAPPPPEPILPTEFSIQLYNPDQQIIVRHKPKTWNKPARWEFEMPQLTFRTPSTSTLDHTQIDPATADVTPKLRFSWRKDGKLSKDLSCLLHGKTSTAPETKNKSREPDITVALFQSLRELTMYEPNLYRVDMEDFKGLEVVLLLAAVAIRDIFFGPAKEAFHIVAGGPTPVNGRAQAAPPGRKSPQVPAAGAVQNGKPIPPRLSIPLSQSPAPQARKRQDELAQEETRRTQELLAAEKRSQEQSRRRQQSEIEKETKRLQKIYGQEEQQARLQKPNPAPSPRPNLPPRHSGPSRPYAHQHSQSLAYLPQGPAQPPRQTRPQRPQGASVPTFANSPYLHGPGRVDPRVQSSANLMPARPVQARPQSTVGFYPQPTSSGALQPGPKPQQLQPKKSSFFGFRRNKEESSTNRLDKKRSSMF